MTISSPLGYNNYGTSSVSSQPSPVPSNNQLDLRVKVPPHNSLHSRNAPRAPRDTGRNLVSTETATSKVAQSNLVPSQTGGK